MSEFIASLSDDYEDMADFNVQYATDEAERYLKGRSLELLKDKLTSALIDDDPIKGEAAVANFLRVGKPDGDTVDILHDPQQIIDAYTLEDEVLFRFPGAMRDTVGPLLRGDLSAFIGKPKGKKSFALMFAAQTAIEQGCKVAYFTWEMRGRQLVRRTWQSFTNKPPKDMVLDMPEFSLVSSGSKTEDAQYDVQLRKVSVPAIDLTETEEMQSKLRKRFGLGDLRMVTFPAYSATVEDMVAQLDAMAWYENFVPDLVIVDYADIIKPSKGAGTEYRHQLDSIWKGLRALAQMRKIHVMTASQTNRAGLKGDIELEHIAEDMRKLTHVSILLALNQTPEEREVGIMRVKTLLNRDDDIRNDGEAVVLQQLGVGRFHLDSKFRKNVILPTRTD